VSSPGGGPEPGSYVAPGSVTSFTKNRKTSPESALCLGDKSTATPELSVVPLDVSRMVIVPPVVSNSQLPVTTAPDTEGLITAPVLPDWHRPHHKGRHLENGLSRGFASRTAGVTVCIDAVARLQIQVGIVSVPRGLNVVDCEDELAR